MGRSRKAAPRIHQATSRKPRKSLNWVEQINARETKSGSSKKSVLAISKPSQQLVRWTRPGYPVDPCGPFFLGIAGPSSEDIMPLPPHADLGGPSPIPRRQWRGEELWSQLMSPRWSTRPISTQPEGSGRLVQIFERREARPRPPNLGRWPPMCFLFPCRNDMAVLGNTAYF